MIELKTMTMQIIGANPDGIKICRVAGSTLVTVIVPRGLLSDAKKLPEIPSRGVYYLLDDNKGRLRKVYAGQTVVGISRLDGHNAKKDWWNKAVMFLAPDTEFSMDIVSGLEATAISYIRDHGSYEVDNADDPKPYVSPYNESFIQSLHEDILFRMTVLGFDLDAVGDDAGVPKDDVIFHTAKRGIRGLGLYNAEQGTFDVLPDSQVDMGTIAGTVSRPIQSINEQRSRLLESGALIFDAENNMHILKEKESFNSPSAAAVFVLGGSQNGWTEWVDSSGRTLSSVYRKDSVMSKSAK